MTMRIIESIETVLKRPIYVGVDRGKVEDFARNVDRNRLAHWLSVSPFDLNQLDEAEKIGFLFTLDSISFCYWGNPKWKVEYRGKEYDGAQAMMACLGRAIENGVNFNPFQLANIKRKELENILRGNVEIPLLNERLEFLMEVGMIIQSRFNGDFRYFIDRAQNDALRLVDLLVENFLSFKDSSIYKGKEVEFSKRAQSLASDLNYLLGLDNIDKLTACADYKLPQVLRRHKILQYSDELQRRISVKERIPKGSEEEIEIRALTIFAVELITKEILGVTSNKVNDYLWLEGQIKLPSDEPYHLTRTTAY